MSGSTTFYLALYSTNLIRRVVRIINDLVDLSTISTEYYKFVDIFNKVKVETLALYHLYDLQIKLEDEKKPFIRTIYSLSTTEQEVFKKLINKNLNNEFIQLASSLYGAPVLFIKKKDGSFHLYVNF